MFTTFSGFIHILTPISLNFNDKLNLAAAILYLFINIIFPFLLYSFTFKNTKKSKADVVLNCAKFSRKGFILEMILSLLRNFYRASIHALFLKNQEVQLIGLIVVDSLIIVITIIIRRGFMNKAMFIGYLFYFVGFLIFDTLLYTRKANCFEGINYD